MACCFQFHGHDLDILQNQSLLASSLQTAYNLNVLPELVQRFVVLLLTRQRTDPTITQSHLRPISRRRGKDTNDLRHDENIEGCLRERCVLSSTLSMPHPENRLRLRPDSHRYLHLHSSLTVSYEPGCGALPSFHIDLGFLSRSSPFLAP